MSPAAKRKKLPLPEPCIKMLPLSFLTSLPQPLTPLPRPRFTKNLITLSRIRLRFTSVIACLPASSVMRLWYSTRAVLSSREPTILLWRIKTENTMSYGRRRHSITQFNLLSIILPHQIKNTDACLASIRVFSSAKGSLAERRLRKRNRSGDGIRKNSVLAGQTVPKYS